MSYFFLLFLLLAQCSSVPSKVDEPHIQVQSIDPEDFHEQLLSLDPTPFELLVPEEWTLTAHSNELHLEDEHVLHLIIDLEAHPNNIPEGAKVIASVDNKDITSFCVESSCVIQKNGSPLVQAQALTEEGSQVLRHLR